jgi:hypothetical protein
VGMFRRAFGGWVEYGRYLLEVLQPIEVTDESKRLEETLADIRILYKMFYSKKKDLRCSAIK